MTEDRDEAQIQQQGPLTHQGYSDCCHHRCSTCQQQRTKMVSFFEKTNMLLGDKLTFEVSCNLEEQKCILIINSRYEFVSSMLSSSSISSIQRWMKCLMYQHMISYTIGSAQRSCLIVKNMVNQSHDNGIPWPYHLLCTSQSCMVTEHWKGMLKSQLKVLPLK